MVVVVVVLGSTRPTVSRQDLSAQHPFPFSPLFFGEEVEETSFGVVYQREES